MRTLYDIIADAIRNFWNETGFPEEVVVFFDQKYDYEDRWEHIRCIVSPNSSNDFETVCFDWDFCEGQQDVKDIKIVTLEEVLDKFEEDEKNV